MWHYYSTPLYRRSGSPLHRRFQEPLAVHRLWCKTTSQAVNQKPPVKNTDYRRSSSTEPPVIDTHHRRSSSKEPTAYTINHRRFSLYRFIYIQNFQTGIITTGIWLFAECHILCRVFYFGHSAKSSLPSATQKTLGKRKHSAKKLFAECFIFDTRQRVSLPSVFFWHSAKGSLPSVTNTTLGKELFAECFFSNTRQRQFKNHILK